ncbi:MAG: hypoxanthine phosphoribosyltransferase [Candidatus Cyclobacteriaceae bacterium M3_2C_046]
MIIKDKEFVLFMKKEEIQLKVLELAQQIKRDYAEKNPIFLAVLNGAFIFAADLIRNLGIPSEISFVKLASYKSMSTTGKIRELIGLDENLKGRHILVVEDIVDTGYTLSHLIQQIRQQEPASVNIASLLFKPEVFKKNKFNIPLKYVAQEIPDKFVVGYGLDFDGQGRHLKDIYQVKA